MLNILHVVFGCTPGAFFGGVSKIVYQLACAQAQLGSYVRIATTNYTSNLPMHIFGNTLVKHGQVEIAYYDAQFWPQLRSAPLKKAISQTANQYDVLHTHNTFLSFNRYVRRSAALSKRPYFVHTHGALDPVAIGVASIKSIKKRIYISLFEKNILNSAAGVFANTEHERSQLSNFRVRSPIYILPNGTDLLNNVDASRFRSKWNIPADSQIILFLGRINRKKGIDMLVQAFAQVAPHWPTAMLLLCGDRSKDVFYANCLDSMCEEYKIKGRVIWTGFLDEKAKLEAFSAATVFSHVSKSEGMAMSILEAMAAGLPVIVGHGCYMDRAVQEGAVALSRYDPICLGQKIEELLKNCELRNTMSQKAIAFVAANHSWEAIARESLRIYRTAS